MIRALSMLKLMLKSSWLVPETEAEVTSGDSFQKDVA